jgi:HK97 family phage prohead protease
MVAALQRWGSRPIPLAWDHGRDPHDIVGSVDGQSAKQVGNEVQVAGRVDIETERGKQIFRLMKRRTMGFSFGFLAAKARNRPGGKGQIIEGVDIFEITATSVPANADTRVLGTKAASMSTRELFAEVVSSKCPRTTASKVIDTRPIRVASFEC